MVDPRAKLRQKSAVLQYNETPKPHGAHLAHAAVVSLHMLCCGLPAAFALAGAATMGAAVLGGTLGRIHHFLHGYELWVLALSAFLVVIGAVMEWRHRAHHCGFPVMFAVSVACLFLNAGLIASHRLTDAPAANAERASRI